MTTPVSGADIVIPSSPQTIAIDEILHSIRQMLDGCGTSNRNDLAIIAIEALIDVGVNTGPRIIGAAVSIGFNRAHVGAILTKSEGGNPDRHRWQRDAEGTYRLHPIEVAV